MLRISNNTLIPENEIELTAVRAQGAGGQNVNKVSTAIHLRFEIASSSLPLFYKERLLRQRDHRISGEGVIIIKAQRYRSQEKNREDAIARLVELIRSVALPQKKRVATRPGRAARQKRLDAKAQRARTKVLRGRVRGSGE